MSEEKWHEKIPNEAFYDPYEPKIKTKEVFDGDWKNIDHENFRVYVFPCGCKVVIDHPLKINISESGGHRILDIDNIAHYIPSGWIHLFWETNDDIAFRF